jgi:muramidase (phage lysozyme)
VVKTAMKHRDLEITASGQYQVCPPVREWDLLRTPYRFHRFLTEVEDTLEAAIDETDCLPQLRLLVRRLIHQLLLDTDPIRSA